MKKPPNKELLGQRFGRLLVISKADNIVGKSREYGAWNCLCDCGGTKIAATYHLNRGNVESCGCINKENRSGLQVNEKINRLTLIEHLEGISGKNMGSRWRCLCECGNETIVGTQSIKSGNTKSCGCFNTEMLSERAWKLIEGRRQFSPMIASARRQWNSYKGRDPHCMDFENYYLVSQQNCHYCGIVPSRLFNSFLKSGSDKGKAEGDFIYNGMDRIDSDGYHTTDNVVPCCSLCNRTKNDRDYHDFLNYIENLVVQDFTPNYFEQIKILELPDNNYCTTSISGIFNGYKKDSDLTLSEFYTMTQMPCFYCNCEKRNSANYAKSCKRSSLKAKEQGWFYYNGIDRIDSSLGHIKGNIVPCCYYCNFAKGKLTLEEFQTWIKRIKEYQKNKSPILLPAQQLVC